MNWDIVEEKAYQWIMESGELIRSLCEEGIRVQTKVNQNDLVTNVDRAVEKFFVDNIHRVFPTHRIIGEEGFGDEVSSMEGIVWIIDPIDGTKNFVHMKRHFALSIGVYENGKGILGFVYDVMANDLYTARKGNGAWYNKEKIKPLATHVPLQRAIVNIHLSHLKANSYQLMEIANEARGFRSIGCAAIELAYIATGKMDMFVSPAISLWDIAAGRVILEEVGGIITQLNGEPLQQNDSWKTPVFAANPYLYQEVFQKYLDREKSFVENKILSRV